MKLKLVDIEGFRSIRKKVTLIVEPNVTVVLGPNDHGKSNVLAAFSFLNEEMRFDPENDLNWDLEEQSEAFPYMRFVFSLNQPEREGLRDFENTLRNRNWSEPLQLQLQKR